MADCVFGEKDNGALVELRRGAKITIELAENPTTGYRWIINWVDEVFLVPEGDSFLTDNRMGLGGGGLRRFFFRAKAPGRTTLSLINKRAWQRDDQAVGSFKLTIHVVK